MIVTMIYRHRGFEAPTFAASIHVVDFETSGIDHDTPEMRESAARWLRARLIETGKDYHRRGGVPMPPRRSDFYDRTELLAAYCDQRPKALFERWSDPIPLAEAS